MGSMAAVRAERADEDDSGICKGICSSIDPCHQHHIRKRFLNKGVTPKTESDGTGNQDGGLYSSL
jgi:hypothetical protein